MTTSQADPAYSTAEEPANPANPITDPSAPVRGANVAETGGSTAGGAMGSSAKEQLSFAARHRAPTTKDVETNRWTGAAPGTLKSGKGGLHGGGLVPDEWTPADGPVGGSTEATGTGGSGLRNVNPVDREVGGRSLRREEEMGMAGAGVGAGTGAGAGAMREGYGDDVGRSEMRREEGYGYENTTGVGTGMGTTGGPMGTTSEFENRDMASGSGTARGAEGYEHAHGPSHGLRGEELRRGDFATDESTRGHTYSDSGVAGMTDDTIKGHNMGEQDDEVTGRTKKNPLAKIVDAVKHI